VLERHRLAGGARELDLALEDAEQVVPAPRLTVEPVERLDGIQVVAIDVEDRLVGLDRLGHVAQLAVVDLAEDEQHLLALVGRRRVLGLLGVDVLERAPALELDVEPLEGVERRPSISSILRTPW
jgi:hypothetical protein